MRKNSVKNNRINEEVRKELSKLIRDEVKDPRVGLMTSVTEAEVAPDLKSARIYISVLGDEETAKQTLRGLKSSAGFLRRQLARSMNLRNTPELFFILDSSIARGVEMTHKIDEVMKDMPVREEEEDLLLDDDLLDEDLDDDLLG